MIPKVIHQIWLSDDMPEHVKAWTDTWKNIPDFEYKLWRADAFNEVGGKEAFLNYFGLQETHPALISDLLRIFIVIKYGGFYVDCDCEYVGAYPISYLSQCEFITNLVGSQNSAPVTYNEFFGAVPNHRILQSVLKRFEYNRLLAKNPLWKYGYQMFGEVITFDADIDMSFINPKNAALCFKHHMMHSWTGDKQ